MGKKINRNAICPLCNSGLKYKKCCGREEPIKANSLRYIGDRTEPKNDFEKNVYESLGYFPNDYISPIKKIGKILYIVIDESNVNDYYSVSGIVFLKSEIDNNINIKTKLDELTEKYCIANIHFTEIFGRNKVLGNRKNDFIDEYIEIVKNLEMKAFSICMSLNEIKEFLNIGEVTKEQCYNAITWRLMFDVLIYCIGEYGIDLIIEMWREFENITDDKRILHQINAEGIIKSFPFANISIYRHYIVFMKEDLLFSSLSDFIAYLSSGLYPKMKHQQNYNQLANDYYDLLRIYKGIFKGDKKLNNDELDKIVTLVEEREYYQRLR